MKAVKLWNVTKNVIGTARPKKLGLNMRRRASKLAGATLLRVDLLEELVILGICFFKPCTNGCHANNTRLRKFDHHTNE